MNKPNEAWRCNECGEVHDVDPAIPPRPTAYELEQAGQMRLLP